MVAPIIAALGRMALSSAAKKTAASQITSRQLAVARNRYVRAAARYANEALEVGERTRYGQLLKKASNRVQHFADKLTSLEYARSDARTLDVINESEKYLVSKVRGKTARGNVLGETLLNGTMQGHRFFAVTRELWEGGAESYEERFDQIRDAFGGKSLSEIILEIEEKTGVNIMKGDINSKSRYGTLSRAEVMKVEAWIIENKL